jgi:hypothetical protein
MLGTNCSISQGTVMENDKIEVYNYLDGHSVINNSIIEGHFPNHGSFFKCPHRYMDSCRTTHNLIVGGFKNRCRVTDVNLNNLPTINKDIYILNSIFFFKPKILTQEVRRSELTNPDLIGT